MSLEEMKEELVKRLAKVMGTEEEARKEMEKHELECKRIFYSSTISIPRTIFLGLFWARMFDIWFGNDPDFYKNTRLAIDYITDFVNKEVKHESEIVEVAEVN